VNEGLDVGLADGLALERRLSMGLGGLGAWGLRA
jgi:hypothetical protein